MSYLILRTIGIDVEFAADLLAVASPAVWERIRPAVRGFIDCWGLAAKRRVVRFVLRSGKEDFTALVWDAINVRKPGHFDEWPRVRRFSNPRILGPDWKKKCVALPRESREELLTMLASNSGLEGAVMALEGAAADKDPKVQAAVVDMLDFYQFEEELAELLKSALPETWEHIVRNRVIDGLWEGQWRPQALAAARRIFARLPAGAERIDWALRLGELGESVDIDIVNEFLDIKIDDHHNELSLLARMARTEGDRLSNALIESVIQGRRVPFGASKFIVSDPPISQKRLLDACHTKPQFLHHQILSPLLNLESLHSLLTDLLALHARARTATGREQSTIFEKYRMVQDSLILANRNLLAELILNWTPTTSEDIGNVCDFLMRAFRDDSPRDEREPLRPDLRERLVEQLAAWSSQVISDTLCSRHVLHSVAEAIATFPSTRLLAPLRELLSEDLKQWRAEKSDFTAEITQGKRPSPDSGAHMSYAFRYGQNMLSLATGRSVDEAQSDDEKVSVSREMTEAVIDILGDFLLDYEFGEDAARVIATLRPDPIVEIGKPRRFMSDDLRVVPERRNFRAEHGERPIDPIATRLIAAIHELKSNGTQDALQHAIKLARSAVRMNCGYDLEWITSLVFEHGSLENKSHHMMLLLLFGHAVNGEVAEQCLKQLDGRREERKWEYEQSWHKWQELLVLMVFGGMPLEATELLQSYAPRGRDHDERRLVEALGFCGHPDALVALDSIYERCSQLRILHEWFAAVHTIGSAESANKLLSQVLTQSKERDWHRDRNISVMVAGMVDKHTGLRQRMLDIAQTGGETELGKLSSIIEFIHDEEFLVDLVSIPGERLTKLSGAVAAALRELCIEYRPIEDSSGSETEPRSVQKLRAQLFARAIANDSGSDACRKLLEYIDQIREDYGTPAEEARHPNIAFGQPWPPAARTVWEASEAMIANARAAAKSTRVS